MKPADTPVSEGSGPSGLDGCEARHIPDLLVPLPYLRVVLYAFFRIMCVASITKAANTRIIAII